MTDEVPEWWEATATDFQAEADVDCGDATPSATLTIADGRTRLAPDPCK